MLPTVEWKKDHVIMVDQRKLPTQEIYVELRTARDVARAIEKMVIRGAPAIGVAAAMGLALGVTKSRAKGSATLASEFYKLCDMMASTRPTAVNLFWAIECEKISIFIFLKKNFFFSWQSLGLRYFVCRIVFGCGGAGDTRQPVIS